MSLEGLTMFLAALAGVILVLVVLIQNPKGGGLSSSFASANQIGGVRRTTDFLEKATWTLAIAIVVLSMASSMFMDRGGQITSDEDLARMRAELEQVNTGAVQSFNLNEGNEALPPSPTNPQ